MKILSICGSPRAGNSEAIIRRLDELLKAKGAENEIILLRKQNIQPCAGCVEYCNKRLKCWKKDDMPGLLDKMLEADGYIFISPNYFKMPSGLFKNFIDRCSVLYTAKVDLSKKRAVVIATGADEVKHINVCLRNITDNFCKALGIKVVAAKSFRSKSEFEGDPATSLKQLNPGLDKDLERMVAVLMTRRKR
jgi:multimeric flavodoxin WrbA